MRSLRCTLPPGHLHDPNSATHAVRCGHPGFPSFLLIAQAVPARPQGATQGPVVLPDDGIPPATAADAEQPDAAALDDAAFAPGPTATAWLTDALVLPLSTGGGFGRAYSSVQRLSS